jgi:hypothetical protein
VLASRENLHSLACADVPYDYLPVLAGRVEESALFIEDDVEHGASVGTACFTLTEPADDFTRPKIP